MKTVPEKLRYSVRSQAFDNSNLDINLKFCLDNYLQKGVVEGYYYNTKKNNVQSKIALFVLSFLTTEPNWKFRRSQFYWENI